jgi:hypothetical protein
MVLAMVAGRGRLEPATADPHRLHVQQVDVDCPLAERIDDEHRRHGHDVAPAEVADRDPHGRNDDDGRGDHPGRALARELPPRLGERLHLPAPPGGAPSLTHRRHRWPKATGEAQD